MSKHPFHILVSLLAPLFFAIVPIQSAFAKNDLAPYQKAAIATRFLTVVTAMIATFLGIGIADSEWLIKKVSNRFVRYCIGLLIALIVFCPFFFGV